MFVIGPRYERHWTARAARVLVEFCLRDENGSSGLHSSRRPRVRDNEVEVVKHLFSTGLNGRKTGDDGYGNEIWSKPHWTARAVIRVGSFGKENWRYLMTSGIAAVGVVLLYRK